MPFYTHDNYDAYVDVFEGDKEKNSFAQVYVLFCCTPSMLANNYYYLFLAVVIIVSTFNYIEKRKALECLSY